MVSAPYRSNLWTDLQGSLISCTSVAEDKQPEFVLFWVKGENKTSIMFVLHVLGKYPFTSCCSDLIRSWVKSFQRGHSRIT